MTFQVISPGTMTDAMLVSSTVPETDYAAWSAVTSYTVGTKVIRATTHKVYENLIAGVDATLPENATGGATPRWLDLGATNRWAMFDSKVGTATTSASTLTVVLDPGSTSGLGLLELVGEHLTITGTAGAGGPTVYSQSLSLDGTLLDGFFDWFYADREQRSDVVLTDLPTQFFDLRLTLSVTTYGGQAAIGVCKLGKVHSIGGTEYGAKATIDSYSRKERDAFGVYSITPRTFSKRTNQRVVTDANGFNRIFRLLSGLESTACIWLASSSQKYQPLVVYGFYKSFDIDVTYHNIHYCNLEIEGLV